MSDFPFESVYRALADRPLSVNAIATKVGAWCRPGVMNPDLVASLNFMQAQDRIGFRDQDCGGTCGEMEHDSDRCLLEVTS